MNQTNETKKVESIDSDIVSVVKRLVDTVDQLSKKIEALESIVVKNRDSSIGLPKKANYNTDPGPFQNSPGLTKL